MIEVGSQLHDNRGLSDERETIESVSKSKDSPNSNNSEYITLEQVIDLIPKSNSDDKEVDQYVQKNAMFILEHKVKKVNKFINEIRSYWADATPMEMVIAFDESNGDIDELTVNLLNEQFKNTVKSLLRKRLSQEYSTDEKQPTQEA